MQCQKKNEGVENSATPIERKTRNIKTRWRKTTNNSLTPTRSTIDSRTYQICDETAEGGHRRGNL